MPQCFGLAALSTWWNVVLNIFDQIFPPELSSDEGQGLVNTWVAEQTRLMAKFEYLVYMCCGYKYLVPRTVRRWWLVPVVLFSVLLELCEKASYFVRGYKVYLTTGSGFLLLLWDTWKGIRVDVSGTMSVRKCKIKTAEKQSPPGLPGIVFWRFSSSPCSCGQSKPEKATWCPPASASTPRVPAWQPVVLAHTHNFVLQRTNF